MQGEQQKFQIYHAKIGRNAEAAQRGRKRGERICLRTSGSDVQPLPHWQYQSLSWLSQWSGKFVEIEIRDRACLESVHVDRRIACILAVQFALERKWRDTCYIVLRGNVVETKNLIVRATTGDHEMKVRNGEKSSHA